MSGNIVYLNALKTPVVIWENPDQNKVKVINPDISLSRFQIEFDNVGTRSLQAYIYTPRLQIYSVGGEDDTINLRDLQFMTDLYGSKEVMEKYADGKPRLPGAVKQRFDTFSENWQVRKSPFSGFMCCSGDEQVGVFNIGNSDKSGIAEFAAISAKKHWGKGYASEFGLLLYKYPKIIRDAGYKMADGSVLQAITATARPDNGSAFVMERLGLTCTGTEEKYGAERKLFLNTVDELENVVHNTHYRATLKL